MRKTKAEKSEPFGAKKQFVLQQDSAMPAAEVVRRAKKEGLKLSPAYVYIVRSEARRSHGQGNGRKTAPASRDAMSLASIALELGLQRSSELLEHLRKQVRSLG